MLVISLIAVLLFAVIAMSLSSRIRTSVLVVSLAVLFMPFGALVAIGWIIPKALLLFTVVPLKDALS